MTEVTYAPPELSDPAITRILAIDMLRELKASEVENDF